MQSGTNVRAKVAPTGLFTQECYDKYYGCMDQFCIVDNAAGGSCACSDENEKFLKQLADIETQKANAENIRTIEVERIQAGGREDIIFGGMRNYDAAGNIIKSTSVTAAEDKAKKRADLMALFETPYEEEFSEDIIDSIATKKGAALYNSANTLCRGQLPDSCTKEMSFLTQMYSTQIKSDCKTFENFVTKEKAAADLELAEANAAVRGALDASFKAANQYDLGQCMVKFRECMQGNDACGADWSKCVSSIASENMQNLTAKSTAKTKVAHVSVYDITDSTLEMLDAKRTICENVLNSCVVVRDMVYPAFLREAAPTIKVAEQTAESKMRQGCLTTVSECVLNSCKVDIEGKGVATMDACLAYPNMARSFCKVEIDRCERMEPNIWTYVTDKLAAQRVDACTAEVKECFTSPDRCGTDFTNCIGMDYRYIREICPLDKLVVCRKNNPKFAMSDLDTMLTGLYLNIDNSLADACQAAVDRKMAEVCGGTTNCDTMFAKDDVIGTNSLRAQKDGNVYRVTGMISFGSVKMGDETGKITERVNNKVVKLGPGEIGVQDYLEQVRNRNAGVANFDGIMSSISEELNHIAGSINRTIKMIEQDQEIQYCINGRDMSQITGKAKSTTARYPNILNSVKVQIAASALRKANDNYNAKFTAAVADATKDASADLAQYMCQKIAEGSSVAGLGNVSLDTPLTPPYAISYDVGAGLTLADLTRGGAGVLKAGGVKFSNTGYLGGGKLEGGGMTKETTAIFNRADRNCHVCTTTMTEDCKTTGSSSWFHNSRNTSCETKVSEPKCEDIKM